MKQSKTVKGCSEMFTIWYKVNHSWLDSFQGDDADNLLTFFYLQFKI